MSVEIATGGTRKHYGPRTTEDKVPSVIRTASETVEMVVDFNYDDLPAASTNDALVLSIPAGAFIESALLSVKDAWVGGTDIDIGLQQSDGTEIDNDGIDAAVLTAALTAGAHIVSDGVLIGASIGAAAGQIVVAATGVYTAGSAKLTVRYRKAA